MPVKALVETFSKSTINRTAVEKSRQDRLTIIGALSSVITEDADNWILTTNISVRSDVATASPPASASKAPLMLSSPPSSTLAVTVAGSPVFGADSLSLPSTGKLTTISTKLGVISPAFWGRYFYAPGQIDSRGIKDAGHYSASENEFLRGLGLRVLAIARQTGNVADSAAQASKDAQNNIAALFESFPAAYLAGADPNVLMFLDVEEASDQPHLSKEYYTAWSAALEQAAGDLSSGRVRVQPAIYTSTSARETFLAVEAAMAGGAHCAGVWTARGLSHGSPLAFSDAQMLPIVPLSCPTLLCQYYLSPRGLPPDENIDMSVSNPAHVDMLLSGLVMPP